MCDTIFGSVDSREGVLRLNGLLTIKKTIKKTFGFFERIYTNFLFKSFRISF